MEYAIRRVENGCVSNVNHNVYEVNCEFSKVKVNYPLYTESDNIIPRCKLMAQVLAGHLSRHNLDGRYNKIAFVGRGSSGMYIIALINCFFKEISDKYYNIPSECYHIAKDEEIGSKHSPSLHRLEKEEGQLIVWCDDFISSGNTLRKSRESLNRKELDIDVILLMCCWQSTIRGLTYQTEEIFTYVID